MKKPLFLPENTMDILAMAQDQSRHFELDCLAMVCRPGYKWYAMRSPYNTPTSGCRYVGKHDERPDNDFDGIGVTADASDQQRPMKWMLGRPFHPSRDGGDAYALLRELQQLPNVERIDVRYDKGKWWMEAVLMSPEGELYGNLTTVLSQSLSTYVIDSVPYYRFDSFSLAVTVGWLLLNYSRSNLAMGWT